MGYTKSKDGTEKTVLGGSVEFPDETSFLSDTKFEGDLNVDGNLNVSYNCIDRHAKNNPDKIAIIWEGDDPNETKKITYKELLINVSKAANVLKKIGVKKGDRVTIYLSLIHI